MPVFVTVTVSCQERFVLMLVSKHAVTMLSDHRSVQGYPLTVPAIGRAHADFEPGRLHASSSV